MWGDNWGNFVRDSLLGKIIITDVKFLGVIMDGGV